MSGRIVSQQTCKVCGKKGKYSSCGDSGMICECGKFTPDLYEVEIYHKRKKTRITHDKKGRRIDGYRHAKRCLELIRAEIDDDVFNPLDWASEKANRLLWPNYLDDYLDGERRRLLPKQMATFDKKKSMARHLRGAFAENIKAIRTAQVEDFIHQLTHEGELAEKTIADLATELRYIFNRAERREDIQRAPYVPSVAVPEQPIRWLNHDSQVKVLEKIPEEHRPIFVFLFLYGCRVAEACALCWDQVDFEQGAIFLTRTFSRRKLINTTKTKRASALPIWPDTEAVLRKAEASCRDDNRLPAGEAPVFVNQRARAKKNQHRFYSPDFLNSTWKKALREAGVRDIQLKNATRHSRASQLLNAGMNLDMVAKFLTHTNTAHTKKYAALELGTMRRAVAGTHGEVKNLYDLGETK